MQEELRRSGIEVLSSVPWGTHFCQFYQTGQDLIDTLVPYFKAGLENNEFCMWVTSEPLKVAEARDAMRKSVGDFDEYLRKGQIEIIPYDEWYLLGGTLNDDRVLAGWVSKLEQALGRGYSGLRLTGNTFWLERNHWHAFTEYEAKVNNIIGRYRMIALCTYCLDKCDGAAVIDVVRNHQFALIKRDNRWDIIESTIYKQVRQALVESERDLNRAQAVANTGSWRLDVQRDQLLWSEETYRIFGIPPGRPMTYETFLASVHPEDVEYVNQKWQAALRGEPYDIEHRITVGNEVKWVREKAELEFEPQGALKGGFGTVQDITARKRVENELRVKDYAVASSVNGIAIADLDGNVTYANLACLGMWGYDKVEEILGKHASTFFAKRKEARLAVKKTLEEGAWQGEVKARRRNGSTFDVLVSANLVTNSDEEPFYMMASFVDITEINRMQAALKQEEQIRHTIMENTGAELAYLDPEFNFVMVNSAYARGSGHTGEELVGQNHFTLFPDDENRAIFEQVRDTGKPVFCRDKPFEFKDQPERGVTYWDWSLTPVKGSRGRVQGLVLSLIETTERKKLDQLKDEFIGLVSHELRTPLTVIAGGLSTALTEWDRLPAGEAQQLLRDALLESESLSHLVENLLELSRFQAQQLTLYTEPTDVRVIITEAVSKIKRQAPTHQFSVSLPHELSLINADPLRVGRILYNLLENASKYSPPGSRIRVSARMEPEQLVIGVSDSGKGLSAREQAMLFSPFQRLENIRPDRARGAGLGLMVCLRLVEAHGGEIWVDSKKDTGSTFFFTLPYNTSTDTRQD